MSSDPSRSERREGDAEPGASLFPDRRPLTVPTAWPPTLLVVIDTEEEFDWRSPPDPLRRSVDNIRYQPLLQAAFDRCGVTPAYLVDHPVATSPEAVAILRGFAEQGRCEIGAHLHPWVTPPVEETIDAWHAFACNLPPDLERRKLHTLTAAIAAAFGTRPLIFKAGNYGISRHTAGFLAELGYKVDSSVVPFTDFRAQGGPNFQDWTGVPFQTIEGIVEIPLCAGFAGHFADHGPRVFPHIGRSFGRTFRLPGIAARLSLLERLRLSPEGHTLEDMKRLTNVALSRGERIFMLSLHSSSLLPGATEYVRTEAERTAFIARIEQYIEFFKHQVQGRTGIVSEVAAALAAHAPQE